MKKNTAAARNAATKAWIAVGGLALLGFAMVVIRELPSMRREWRLIRM